MKKPDLYIGPMPVYVDPACGEDYYVINWYSVGTTTTGSLVEYYGATQDDEDEVTIPGVGQFEYSPNWEIKYTEQDNWQTLYPSTTAPKRYAEPVLPEPPASNDGREFCWWCCAKTTKKYLIGQFSIDYCEDCDK